MQIHLFAMVRIKLKTTHKVKYCFALDRSQFASTVLWLEDQKIRFYKIEDREALRAIGITADWQKAWDKAYTQLRNDVGMPAELNSQIEELSWLLSYAVRLEYMDNGDLSFNSTHITMVNASYIYITVDTYKEFTAEKVMQLNKPINPTVASTNPFDKMNMVSEDFKNGVENLTQKLKVGKHVDHLVRLQVASRVIHDQLRPEVLNEPIAKGAAYPIKGGDKCAFDDKDVDQAAKILRLLQIQVNAFIEKKKLQCP